MVLLRATRSLPSRWPHGLLKRRKHPFGETAPTRIVGPPAMRALRLAILFATAMATGASCLPGASTQPPPPLPPPPAASPYPYAGYPPGAYPYYAPYSNVAPAQPPPPLPPPLLAPPPMLAAPAPAAATPRSPAPSAPAGWVNVNGFVLPAIPGLTTPAATGGATAKAAPAPSPPTQATPQPGWVSFGGVMLPSIPGLTAPASGGGAAPAPTNPSKSCGSVKFGNHTFQVDCATPNYAQIPWASILALPRQTLSPTPRLRRGDAAGCQRGPPDAGGADSRPGSGGCVHGLFFRCGRGPRGCP